MLLVEKDFLILVLYSKQWVNFFKDLINSSTLIIQGFIQGRQKKNSNYQDSIPIIQNQYYFS